MVGHDARVVVVVVVVGGGGGGGGDRAVYDVGMRHTIAQIHRMHNRVGIEVDSVCSSRSCGQTRSG